LKLRLVGENSKRKVCREIAKVCIMICENDTLKNDLYCWGWINGVKDAYDLEWKEICSECVGCETPICMPKGGRHG